MLTSSFCSNDFVLKMNFKFISVVSIYLISQICCNFHNNRIDFIRKLIESSFINASCLYFIEEDLNYSNLISQALMGLQLISVLYNNFEILKTVSCDGYILISNNERSVKELFSPKTINTVFKPHSRVLWFTEQLRYPEGTELSEATELHNVDLIIIEENQINPTLVEAETFFRVTSVYHRATINKGYSIKRKYLKKRPWLPEVVLPKFNQSLSVVLFECPPYVIWSRRRKIYDGIDIKILNEVTKNWPVRYIFLTQSKDSAEFLYTKALMRVVDNKNDLAVCSQWQISSYKHDIAKTVQYTTTCRRFLVPRSELLPNYTFVFHPLQLNLWVVYCLLLLFLPFVMVKTSNIFDGFRVGKSYLKRDFSLAVTYTVRVFSSGAVNRVPLSHQFSLRLLIIALSIFCMLFSTYYSAGLTISLRFPRFSKEIVTLKDVAESDLKWLESNDHLKNFVGSDLGARFERRKGIKEGNEKLRSHKYMVTVQVQPGNDENYVMFSETLDEYGKSNLKVMSEDIACFYCLFPLKVNSPYLNIFNDAVNKFNEYGFVNHWYKHSLNKKKFAYMRKFFQRYSSEVFQNIDFQKFRGIFYILLLGNALAGIVFCLECVINKWQKNT
jgi:hypothetical protein